MKPPFVPTLRNEIDTSYFGVYETNENFYPRDDTVKKKDSEFIGYTFNREELGKEDDDLITVIELIHKKQEENSGKKQRDTPSKSESSNEDKSTSF